MKAVKGLHFAGLLLRTSSVYCLGGNQILQNNAKTVAAILFIGRPQVLRTE